MLNKAIRIFGAVSVALVCSGALDAAGAKLLLTKFEIDGAVDVTVLGENNSDAVTGYYTDSSKVQHGFLRTPDGTITTFDPAGSVSTAPQGISDSGAITGYYSDSAGAQHGFLRTADGTISEFDPKKSVHGTNAFGVKGKGSTVGYYLDVNYAPHGFIRKPGGKINEVTVPNTFESFPLYFGPDGSIIGGAYDMELNQVGFLEDRDGNATLFSGPGGGQTLVGGINDKGYISGSYVESSDTHPFDGYVRAPDGTMTSFKGPSAVWTFAYNINKTGQTAGYYTLAGNLARAYVREPNGKLKTLLFDGATSTAASWINNNGTIAGYWFDSDNHSHGCLWLQQ